MAPRILEQRLRVLGTGSALPGPAVPNDVLLDAIAHLIGRRARRKGRVMAKRLGITSRHLVRDLQAAVETPRAGDENPDLAARAVRHALDQAGCDPSSLAYLLGHTTSPKTRVPPSVAWAADRLDYDGPFAELRQACTGFANALQMAAGMVAGGDRVAIVGSETGSVHFEFSPSFADHEQLLNCVQMGDGAGAVVLGPDDGEAGGVIEALWFGSLGKDRAPGFWMDGQPQEGDRVAGFRHDFEAVREGGPALFEAGAEIAASLGHPVTAVDHVLPHQANGRMQALIAEAFELEPARVVGDGAVLGNLGSAAIWVSFDRLLRSGRVAQGDTVLVLGAEATKYLYGGFLYRHG